jgi:hypothetical protein
MFQASKFNGSLAAIAALTVIAATAPNAEAAPQCRPALTGSATSTGMFGLGTQLAREAAIADFEQRASGAYGYRYGDFRRARWVRWNCKKNAILLAKCAVTARPCR